MSLIPLNSIRTDGGTQTRERIDAPTVDEYAEAMSVGTRFPPVVVFFDGTGYWLADGFHRIAAARQNSALHIECDVRQGDRRAAVLYSVGANADNGMRRTNEDKRRAVMRLLDDPEWSGWSDREIGRRCVVTADLVGKLRASLSTSTVTNDVGRTYRHKHGGVSKMNTEKIGKRSSEPAVTATKQPATVAWSDSRTAAKLERRRVVAQMHENGLNGAEIAEKLGVSRSTVVLDKIELGVADSSPSVKSWDQLQKLEADFVGKAFAIEDVIKALHTGDVSATDKEVASCIKSLRESMGTFRRLVSELENVLQRKKAGRTSTAISG